MRILFVAGSVAALLSADAAAGQRVVAHGPGAGFRPPAAGGVRPMPGPGVRPMPGPGVRPGVRPGVPGVRPGGHWGGGHWRGGRWGSKVGGRWWGGVNAPGGWGAYRRPYRGWALPRYWVSPQFYISDWGNYGLSQPPYGYNWARYYDDAVLIDGRGSVYDTIDGIDWDGGEGAYDDGGYDGPDAYAADAYAGDDRVYAGPADRGASYRRPDNGVGGAALGAVAGGVAGNLIAGRGNRLGGTLIGAGVGAAAGYAIDKAEDRRRGRVPVAPAYAPPPPPGYGAGYAPPPPPPPGHYAGGPAYAGSPGSWVSPDGATTVVTTSGGGYYGAGTTTVTVQSAPVVTTTTTEIYEDAVTYTAPRKVYRKRVWKKPRCTC